jgi:hypothetical protein
MGNDLDDGRVGTLGGRTMDGTILQLILFLAALVVFDLATAVGPTRSAVRARRAAAPLRRAR